MMKMTIADDVIVDDNRSNPKEKENAKRVQKLKLNKWK